MVILIQISDQTFEINIIRKMKMKKATFYQKILFALKKTLKKLLIKAFHSVVLILFYISNNFE